MGTPLATSLFQQLFRICFRWWCEIKRHFHNLTGNSAVILSTVQLLAFFQFVVFILTFDLQKSEVPCVHAAVTSLLTCNHFRIFRKEYLTYLQKLRCFVVGNLCRTFLVQKKLVLTANGSKFIVCKTLCGFSGTPCRKRHSKHYRAYYYALYRAIYITAEIDRLVSSLL